MKTLKKSQIGSETRFFNVLVKKFGRVNADFQRILKNRGYELCDLGTSTRCYTASCDVGYKKMANDNAEYFGVGIYNHATKTRSGIGVLVYRAWVKKVN